jgi:hypothetical protein
VRTDPSRALHSRPKARKSFLHVLSLQSTKDRLISYVNSHGLNEPLREFANFAIISGKVFKQLPSNFLVAAAATEY